MITHQEELDQIRAQRTKNRELHGATAPRSNTHKATVEAETPRPGYVPVWASNGIMSVIIYVTPFSVLPSLTPEQLRTAHYAACAAKETAAIAAFVALPATERKAIRDAGMGSLFLTLGGIGLCFICPVFGILCLPLTGFFGVQSIRKSGPTGMPSEEEIFRAEVLKRL